MLKKCYVANCIIDGKLCGYVTCRIWFWVSPYEATNLLISTAKKIGGKDCHIVDIRRLK